MFSIALRFRHDMSVDSPLGDEFADTYRDRSVPATPGAIDVDDAEPLGEQEKNAIMGMLRQIRTSRCNS